MPVKKRFKEEPSSATQIDIGLKDIIDNGPYSKLLLNEEFIEVDEKIIQLLNDDWSTFPHVRFSCVALLPRMVITNHNKAIVVNCVEVIVPTSSLPPPPQNYSRYENLWITSMDDGHGHKLILETKTFNSLSTSSLGLDVLKDPDVWLTSSFGNCLGPAFIKPVPISQIQTKFDIFPRTWYQFLIYTKLQQNNIPGDPICQSMVANDSNDENFMKNQRIGLSADTFIREFGPIALVVTEVIPGTHYYPYEDCPTRINHIKQENVSEN